LRLLKFILIISLLFTFSKVNAAYHAGHITYAWLYGYTYQIKLTTYTTISSISSNTYCEDSLCFGDGQGVVVVRNNGGVGLCSPPAHDGVIINSFIKMNEYITTHTYPGPGNYIICFNESNRNAGINNIPNSVNQPFSLESYLVIPTFGSGKNSSSVCSNLAIADGCSNNGCFTYNPSATDSDGDSLSYEILPCVTPGASLPAAGTSGTFNINPVSGLLTWCSPQYNGDYNVIIKIKEWRKDDDGNNILMGYVIRDTQFNITTCTGVIELDNKNTLVTIYPNPTLNVFKIQLNEITTEEYSMYLIDMSGRVLLQTKNVQFKKEEPYFFNIEDVSKGIYFLKITGNHQTNITKKIIKQ
jgi:hypothetical protein